MEDLQVVPVPVPYGVEAVAVDWVPSVHYSPYAATDAETDHVVHRVESYGLRDVEDLPADEVHLVDD